MTDQSPDDACISSPIGKHCMHQHVEHGTGGRREYQVCCYCGLQIHPVIQLNPTFDGHGPFAPMFRTTTTSIAQ